MIQIRPMQAGDARAVEEVRLAGWRGGYAGLLPAELLAGLTVTEERVRRWAAIAEDPNGSNQVAVVDGQVVGAAMVGPARDPDLDPPGCAELYLLYVRPASWGTGLGTALMYEAFAGCPRPLHVLWVLGSNARGRRFYEKRGFRTDGTRKTVDLGGPVEELRYRREA